MLTDKHVIEQVRQTWMEVESFKWWRGCLLGFVCAIVGNSSERNATKSN